MLVVGLAKEYLDQQCLSGHCVEVPDKLLKLIFQHISSKYLVLRLTCDMMSSKHLMRRLTNRCV